jgi:hypothetical protein
VESDYARTVSEPCPRPDDASQVEQVKRGLIPATFSDRNRLDGKAKFEIFGLGV